MHITQTTYLQPGDKLGRPVFTETGRVLVGAGVELTAGMIRRLQELGIETVYVSDSRTDDIVPEDSVSDETRQRAVQMVHDTFSSMIEAKKWNRTISLSRLGTEFRKAFEDILHELQDRKELLIHLSKIYTSSNYLYTHSVNVGIYSAALGMAVGLNRNQLIELGIGAMLHDIGKTMVPLEILEKPGALTPAEFSEIKKHPTYGYDILREFPDIPLLSAHCALQHHERIDGSGYPRGLKDNEIHLYGKIVGLADVYDALISNRSYRKGYLPHEALDIIFASTDKYDMDLMTKFRNHIVIYPVGMMVALSTGERAVVVDVNSKHPHRPIVRVLKNEKGENVKPYEIDLSTHLSVMVTECEDPL
ncbi:HD-GYP domain-containing protein [Effusibacillus lacus]|uniref:Histidine kinase n=1 Tax=Effusibacillus lacus TaxID=1348429 RepID=A0A292YII3_9BACL|nr:HD-GYP domain-containing protein [Effusibacillus lacus]TCS74720.1 HD-GYP domain-containing protein (c-di-GMP phosphodiesterase class II) [Effusibacillus lacus]GAX88533.1 histidine kinase [Effusibacillus lacus]